MGHDGTLIVWVVIVELHFLVMKHRDPPTSHRRIALSSIFGDLRLQPYKGRTAAPVIFKIFLAFTYLAPGIMAHY